MTFTVEHLPGVNLRTAYCSPTEILTLGSMVNFGAFAPTHTMITYALEHTECEINGQWLPVKTKGKEVYMPVDVEQNLRALNEIAVWFFENVIAPVFPESAK